MFLLLLAPAFAYNLLGVERADPHFTFYMEQDQIQGTWRESGLEAAADRFNLNAAVGSIGLAFDWNGTFSTSNGIDELYFLSDADMDTWCGTSSDVACTLLESSGTTLLAADVLFAESVDWDTSLSTGDIATYGGVQRPLMTTALHEFGHAMGLAHEDSEYTIMGQDWTFVVSNNTSYTSQMGEDATSGLAAMYGYAAGNYEDLSIAHWKQTGASGEYAVHERTRLYNATGVPLPCADLPFYGYTCNVTRGQYVYADYTPENNGADTQTTTTHFRWSANSWITASDTSLGTSTFVAYAGSPTTLRSGGLRIPSTATSGTVYYIGAMIDSTGTLSEIDETNNAAFLVAVKVN